jgi:transglutaminase-like putative cysteine protease
MLVRVGCSFESEVTGLTPTIMLVEISHADVFDVWEEAFWVEPSFPVHSYSDQFGNRCRRFVAPVGDVRVVYDALVAIPSGPDPVVLDAPQTPIEDLPDDVLQFTLASRYCQSDLLTGPAWDLFGAVPPGWRRVQAVCDWIHQNVAYGTGSTSTTSALDVYTSRVGVCRDFAHMGVAFCRALSIPARYVFGYLPDAGIEPPDIPMDFHAWFEAFVDGRWRTFDARHNYPRIGRVPIARGRDAVDVAMMTTFGPSSLRYMEVWADEVDEHGRALSGLNAGRLLPRPQPQEGSLA